ncbi:hypothetical protein KY332_01230 [Candidatus Woesearchaeota archaeon]|nr:hypothetical protein [Candidatus Woesearchaeota archaeon]
MSKTIFMNENTRLFRYEIDEEFWAEKRRRNKKGLLCKEYETICSKISDLAKKIFENRFDFIYSDREDLFKEFIISAETSSDTKIEMKLREILKEMELPYKLKQTYSIY